MARDRVSTEDLEAAIEWLRSYEGTTGDPLVEQLERTAQWLEIRLQQRALRAAERRVMRKTGGTAAQARDALAKARTKGAGQ